MGSPHSNSAEQLEQVIAAAKVARDAGAHLTVYLHASSDEQYDAVVRSARACGWDLDEQVEWVPVGESTGAEPPAQARRRQALGGGRPGNALVIFGPRPEEPGR